MTLLIAPVDHNTGKDGCPPLTEVIMPATVGTWLWQLLGAGAVVFCGTLCKELSSSFSSGASISNILIECSV